MKKAILFIVGMLGLVSCYRNGGEENENPANAPEYFKSEVVGTWKPSGYVIYDGRDKNTILEYGQLVGCEINNGYHFANDDTYNEHQYETGTDGRCSDKGEFLGTYGEIRVRSTQNIDYDGDGKPELYVIVYKRGI